MSYTATVTCLTVPTQWEGQTFLESGSRCFYFRGRHSRWTLEISPVNLFGGYIEWASRSILIDSADCEHAGWMNDDEVHAILQRHFGKCLAFVEWPRT